MRIAQVAPLYESVPPKLYGGTERIVAYLAEALARLGHDVTVFASADSAVDGAWLQACRGKALRLDTAPSWDLPAHCAMFEAVRAQALRFDILHFHTDCLQFQLFRDIGTPTLSTLHGRLDQDDLLGFLTHFPKANLVSISDAQRAPAQHLPFRATIHHGLPRDLLPFSPTATGDYLAFLGRTSPEKRPDRAIEIARRANIPLRIAAKIGEADERYFRERIAPMLNDPLIEFIGEIGEAEKASFLGGARALLFPIDWPEPFGLVMIEAMACGTPVIAWPNGAAPEVVEHGVSGYLVESIAAASAAAQMAGALDRRTVRGAFERRFIADVMARRYLTVYRQLASSGVEPTGGLEEWRSA